MHFIKASDWTTDFCSLFLLFKLSVIRFSNLHILTLFNSLLFISFDLASDTSLEDTQASYTERLREKSRSIPMNGNNDVYSHLTRSISKDALNDGHIRSNTHLNITEFPLTNGNILRPKSAGQQPRTAHVITKPPPLETENDFQLKRDFLKIVHITIIYHRILLYHLFKQTYYQQNQKLYTLSPTKSQINNNNNLLQHTIINNNPQRNITR